MQSPIRIVNTGGIGTQLFTADGAEIKGAVALKLTQVGGDCPRVEVSFCLPQIDVMAHPMLSLETVKAAAEFYGYRLEHGEVLLGERTVKHRRTPVDTVDV